MLLQIQTLCYWHWCLETTRMLPKIMARGSADGGRSGPPHPDYVPDPLILGQGGSPGLVSETLCRLQSPLSPCRPPSVSLQEQKHPVQVVGSRLPPGHETVSKSSRLCCGPLLAGAPSPLPFLQPAPTGHIGQGTVRENPRPCYGPLLTGAPCPLPFQRPVLRCPGAELHEVLTTGR